MYRTSMALKWRCTKMHLTVSQVCEAPICAAHHVTGQNPSTSARLMHAACMTHMHVIRRCI